MKAGTITLRRVADEAQVHLSTASRALDPARAHRVNASTAARVRAVADRLGYRPDAIARGLRQGRTSTVGVVVADLANPFLVSVMRGVENVLELEGLMPVIAETQDDPSRLQRALDHLADRRVDALITTAALKPATERLVRFAGHEAPVVLAIRALIGCGLPTVQADDRLGGELVAGYLARLGHKVVTQLRGPMNIQSFADRASGFESSMTSLGGRVVEIDTVASEPTYEEGQRLMGYLLGSQLELPTAVFAHNDPMAIGALDVIKRSGLRCPEDISIVGFNDNPFVDQVCPPLTTVRIHSYAIGRESARMALQLLGGERPADVVIPPELVPRSSTMRRTSA